MLFIQYWLGMSINLFIEIPLKTPLNFFDYSGSVEVLVHIANGILIFAVALAMLAYLLKQKGTLFSKLSVLAAAFVAIAIAGGLMFLLMGQDNSFSMAMAMSFISVYSIYFYEFYMAGRAEVLRDFKAR